MFRPLRAALAALIVAPALVFAPVLTAAADDDSDAYDAPVTTVTSTSTINDKIAAADEEAEPDAPASGVAPSTAQRKSVPYAAFYAPYECNPHATTTSDPVMDRYCFYSDNNRDDAGWAIAWAQDHTKKKDRDPVPFPGLGDGGGGKLAMLPHTTYAVYYSSSQAGFIGPIHANSVWKYGITSWPNYEGRSNVGVKNCNAWAKKKGYVQACRSKWYSVNTATYGWDFGRFMEASLIKEYQRKNGVCPPGNGSCR